jgi:hypoxanthine phosphoribosyltransferase
MKKTIHVGDTKFKVIMDSKTLAKKVKKLSKTIAKNYSPTDIPPILLIVINGAMYFGTDLSQALKKQGLEHMVDTVRIKRYSEENTTEKTRMLSEPCLDLNNRDILVVEDIIDEGKTMQFLNDYLKNKGARSVEYCVLLVKKDHAALGFEIKYSILNDMPPDWIVGYGMDSGQLGRGLNGIYCKV